MSDRYWKWFNGDPVSLYESPKRKAVSSRILLKMVYAPLEWFTGGYTGNGHPRVWGNTDYMKNGVLVNYWPDQTKIDEFKDVSNGFNQVSDASGMTITFKFGNFYVLTIDEAKYWTKSP